VTVGHLRIDETARVAYLGADELALTRKEFDVLAYLAGRTGEVVSKRELAARIWSDPYGGSDRTVDVHLSWLRRKLGETVAAPRYVRTVRGVGIKLVDPR
jgi:DNA-binding response OmpR family regulator